jgi:hypothetical protein
MTEVEWANCIDPKPMLNLLRRSRADIRLVRLLDALRLTVSEEETICRFIRELFRHPSRPSVADPKWLTWNDGIVRKMAQTIYERRCFADLPILADALLDAGCDDDELLRHLHDPGPHMRGCWALDLLLAKE